MRSRLLGVVLALVVLVLVGMGVPLGRGVAATEQQEMFLDRLTDTARFASLVQRPVIDDQPEVVLPELKRYSELYGIDVVLLRRDGQVALSSADREPDLSSPAVQETVRGALAGRLPSNPDLVMPWQDHPLVVAEPVLVDGEVRGAVVTFSPTGKTRTGVALWWLAILAGALGALALAVLAALPLVRWMLRPVLALDDATSGLVGAIVSGRPVPPVGGSSGPPELRQLGRSFDQMAASVGDVLAAQRAFVADASHQLRNPLTALKLRLSNLEDAVTEEGRPHQAAALAEANRLNRILDEMLAMARAESSSVAPVEVDVDRAVAGRLTAWMPAATARDVHLVLGGEPGRMALAPPRGVETVLDALLDNALKFTAEGTLVHVVVRRADGRVRLSVVDEGPGLDEEERERATDRFWRSPSHQNVAGSGLGLSIVRRIVERVGGRVRLFRGDEGGLGVEVDFPASG
ncbi:HAMP domain-containing histidine kinase [Actinosynnema pretiosum subsp. pretiosum]|uniref:histidine kinase n=2 Tax=Actinosynnema TaxID=40566 RepID=C6WAD0_ACTMD|nr:HAMP domain-containing sensor histidine kinase [Actinosynnema mirum]ACU35397.1 histidine kinase [Actinosynnema mirum DSM 43827]AXX28773.1 putative two-component system sensor kinase [Actinosynnema pretiosum subsp. pretiosum]QUF06918.1 HAMP domain-containing histidine kinase [Actinosynnema pretiosum subsp. pretiosum]